MWNFGNEDPVMKAPLPDQQAKIDELDRRVAKTTSSGETRARYRGAQAKWEQSIAKQGQALAWR